jgi:hypothetical protein
VTALQRLLNVALRWPLQLLFSLAMLLRKRLRQRLQQLAPAPSLALLLPLALLQVPKLSLPFSSPRALQLLVLLLLLLQSASSLLRLLRHPVARPMLLSLRLQRVPDRACD